MAGHQLVGKYSAQNTFKHFRTFKYSLLGRITGGGGNLHLRQMQKEGYKIFSASA